MNKNVFKTAGLLSLAVLVLSVLSVAGGWIFLNSSYFAAGSGDAQSVVALFARPMACVGILSVAFAIASLCAYYSENDGYAVFSGVLGIFCMLNAAFDFLVNYVSFDLSAALKLALSFAYLLLFIFFFVASRAYGKANGELAVVALVIMAAVRIVNTVTADSVSFVNTVIAVLLIADLAVLAVAAARAFRNKPLTVCTAAVGILITVSEFVINRFIIKTVAEASFGMISNAVFDSVFFISLLIYTCKALQDE